MKKNLMPSFVAAAAGLALLGAAHLLTVALIGIIALGLGGGLIRPGAMSNLEPHMRDLDPASRRRLTTRMEQLQAVLSAAILIIGGVLLRDVSVASLMLGLAAINLLAQFLALTLARVARPGPRQAPERA